MLMLALPLALQAATPPQEKRFLSAGFDRLRVIGPYDVEIVPGSPGAVASGDRAALDGVSVRVESGVLVISGPPVALIRGAPARRLPLKLRVTTTGLRAITGFDGAAITLGDVHTRHFEIELNGDATLRTGTLDVEELVAIGDTGGTMTLAGKADRLRLRGAGAARITADKLTAGEADIEWASPNPLRVAVRYSADVANYGKGRVTVIGRPRCDVRGGGPITCSAGAPGR